MKRSTFLPSFDKKIPKLSLKLLFWTFLFREMIRNLDLFQRGKLSKTVDLFYHNPCHSQVKRSTFLPSFNKKIPKLSLRLLLWTFLFREMIRNFDLFQKNDPKQWTFFITIHVIHISKKVQILAILCLNWF